MRVRIFASQARRFVFRSVGVPACFSPGGPGISKDHFQSPRYLTFRVPGAAIHGFLMNSSHRSAKGSSSFPKLLLVRAPGLFNLRLLFPKRIESTSFLVCSRVKRSGIILATES